MSKKETIMQDQLATWMTMPPIACFHEWLEAAQNHPEVSEPTAMSLATADKNGLPSCRIVLLKEASEDGFVFYTNIGSGRKSADLKANPQAALCFYWMPMQRQVRVQGQVVPVSDGEADAYFASRHRNSQIGAWASYQSMPLESREQLEKRITEQQAIYEGRDIPRPERWGGWRVIPERMEFWVERPHRLHDRWEFTRDAEGNWSAPQRLYP